MHVHPLPPLLGYVMQSNNRNFQRLELCTTAASGRDHSRANQPRVRDPPVVQAHASLVLDDGFADSGLLGDLAGNTEHLGEDQLVDLLHVDAV